MSGSKMKTKKHNGSIRGELYLLLAYVVVFYVFIIRRSLQISNGHYKKLYALRPGGSLIFSLMALMLNGETFVLMYLFFPWFLEFLPHWPIPLRDVFHFRAKGMSILWLFLSLVYLFYLHGACVIFILSIVSLNFLLVKVFARTNYFLFLLWVSTSYLDNFRGTFRWHICFNLVILRMISFGYDYYLAHQDSRFNHEERSVIKSFTFSVYLCYLVYAPLYIAGPIISFNAFASQLDVPQGNNSKRRDVVWYGLRWVFSLFVMELMTHLFYYNAFAISGIWKLLSPLDAFIIGYGIYGIETWENMPRCLNNCHNMETFWKNWHASFNKWLVRYMYIPLGGSRRKFLNVWPIFTFVALWHDLEWNLLSWAWLTCLFFIPEMAVKSATNTFQAESGFGEFIFRELGAVAGAITITCLMIANLIGYVIGPSGANWLVSQFLTREGLPVLGGMFKTFYIATKLMFHIQDAKQRRQ